MALSLVALAMGCGDRCEQLCQQTASRLAQCRPDGLTWADLGARNRSDFVERCRTDWDRVSADLAHNEMRLALETCADTNRTLDALSCAEVRALYADPD